MDLSSPNLIRKVSLQETQATQKNTGIHPTSTGSTISSVACQVMGGHIFQSQQVRDTIDEIRQLVPHCQPTTQKTDSPMEFLDKLGVMQMLENPFTTADIKHIYSMINAHKMSDVIPFYALFGLEILDILNNLNTLEDFLPKFEREWLVDFWKNIYINYYRTILATDKINFKLIDKLDEDLKTKLKDGLLKKKPNSCEVGTPRYRLSIQLYKKYETEYKSKVGSFLLKWDVSLNLFKKFLDHNQSKRLLNEIRLMSCLGVHETMQFSSKQEIQIAKQHLIKYVTFINEALHGLNFTMVMTINPRISDRFLSIFDNISKEINTHNFGKISNFEKIKDKCQELIALIGNNVLELRICLKDLEGQEDISQEVEYSLIFCYIEWLRDYYNVIQHSILPAVIPTYKSDMAYQNRIFLNLAEIILDSKLEFSSLDDMDVPPSFKRVYQDFYTKTSAVFMEITDVNNKAMACFVSGVNPFYLLTTDLKALYIKLKMISESVLDELVECAEKNHEEFSELQLLSMTKALAKMLIIVHDMDMRFCGESPWPCEFPQKYLEFIGLEIEDETVDDSLSVKEPETTVLPNLTFHVSSSLSLEPVSSEASSSTVEAVTSDHELDLVLAFSCLETKEPPKSSHLEVKEPSKLLSSSLAAETLYNKQVRKQDKPISQSTSFDTTEQTFQEDPRLLEIKAKGLRQLKRALKKLGLIRIEGGCHAKWMYPPSKENPKGRVLATVVPRHDPRHNIKQLLPVIKKEVKENNPARKVQPQKQATETSSKTHQVKKQKNFVKKR